MDKEKIVVVLLLATIALSVVSILMVFDVGSGKIPLTASQTLDLGAGNVQLVINKNPLKEGGEP